MQPFFLIEFSYAAETREFTSLFIQGKSENKELSVLLNHWVAGKGAELTHFQAVERKRVLSDKLIVRRGVVVFHKEAH